MQRLLFCVLLGVGCSGSDDACVFSSDCDDGFMCVDRSCVPDGDAAAPDAATPDAGNDAGADSGILDAGSTDAAVDAPQMDAGPVCTGCTVFFRAPNADSWEMREPSGAAFAPRRPIEAAFRLRNVERAYVLTDTTYHVMAIPGLMWIEEGMRDDLFPELSGDEILGAYAIFVPMFAATAVHLMDDRTNHAFTWNALNNEVTFREDTALASPEEDDNAPDPAAVLAAWFEHNNNEGWQTFNPMAFCGEEPANTPFYWAATTSERVHLHDLNLCPNFYPSEARAEFAPFSTAGAPPPGDEVAAFYHEGFYVFVR